MENIYIFEAEELTIKPTLENDLSADADVTDIVPKTLYAIYKLGNAADKSYLDNV